MPSACQQRTVARYDALSVLAKDPGFRNQARLHHREQHGEVSVLKWLETIIGQHRCRFFKLIGGGGASPKPGGTF